jgi:hypothetical protein
VQQTAARLDIPGQPALLSQREDEPVSSRFTGKPLRRVHWTLAVYGDNAQEQLEAALAAASNDGDLISDGKGTQWSVTDHTYSYQAGQSVTVYQYEVELAEHEDLRLEGVEFEGLDVVPDRWTLESDDHRIWLAFLVNLTQEQHQQFERVLKKRAAEDAEGYFQVLLVGITSSPIEMRFGRCLWKRLDERAVRHRIWLVGEGGDDEATGIFDALNQPELARTIEQSLIQKARMDALIRELQHAGVLGADAAERVRSISTIDDLSFADTRELDRAANIDAFLD